MREIKDCYVRRKTNSYFVEKGCCLWVSDTYRTISLETKELRFNTFVEKVSVNGLQGQNSKRIKP